MVSRKLKRGLSLLVWKMKNSEKAKLYSAVSSEGKLILLFQHHPKEIMMIFLSLAVSMALTQKRLAQNATGSEKIQSKE